MAGILLFAGTTEGRILAEELAKRGIFTVVSAATQYGGSLIKENEFIHVLAGKKNEAEIEALINTEHPDFVIDATHPYAAEASDNIQMACANTKCQYMRLLREQQEGIKDSCVYVDSIAQAVDYLEKQEGNILVTTGSNELKEYTRLTGYEKRLYVRVLSVLKSVEICDGLGIRGSHLIAMQGPFSEEMNLALLRAVSARFLVTKESGSQGGFQQKTAAAKKAGVCTVIIGRPRAETGYSILEVLQKIESYYPQKRCEEKKQEVVIIGTGMGTEDTLTIQARNVLNNCDGIIGAPRVLETLFGAGIIISADESGASSGYVNDTAKKGTAALYKPEEIIGCILSHPEWRRTAIVFSGDFGCFSGAKKLLPLLKQEERIGTIRVVSGISSAVYFLDKLQKTWEDLHMISWHGRREPFLAAVKRHQKTFFFLGGTDDAAGICRILQEYGLRNIQIFIGERLSYREEKILSGLPEDFCELKTDKLSVMLVENNNPDAARKLPGIADEEFIRGKVPMTKQEIRVLCLAKLGLKPDSILYDIGAGTGSVSVEAALQLENGIVYAIERKPEAVELMIQNRKKFALDNMEIIETEAPEGLEELPPPTHLFIGGSGRKMKQILEAVLEKNGGVTIVITAISLETLSEAVALLKKFSGFEVVQVGISKAELRAGYHMMNGGNPVFIISAQNADGGNE